MNITMNVASKHPFKTVVRAHRQAYLPCTLLIVMESPIILIITGHNQSYKDQPVPCLNKDQQLTPWWWERHERRALFLLIATTVNNAHATILSNSPLLGIRASLGNLSFGQGVSKHNPYYRDCDLFPRSCHIREADEYWVPCQFHTALQMGLIPEIIVQVIRNYTR